MQNDPGVTFVNAVLNRGVFNSVVNINFGVLNFTPVQDGQNEDGSPKMEVVPDLVVASRLRMDIECAKTLYESLGSLLTSLGQDQSGVALTTAADEPAMSGKPN